MVLFCQGRARAERGFRLGGGGRFDPRNQSEQRGALTAFRRGSIFDFVQPFAAALILRAAPVS